MLKRLIDRLFPRPPVVVSTQPPARKVSPGAVSRATADDDQPPDLIKRFPVEVPQLRPGVVPAGIKPAIAMDNVSYTYADIANANGFPGYPYLANLATRAEYRAMAHAFSTEMTREWIEITSKETDDDATKLKVVEIEKEFERVGLRAAIQKAAEHDCFFGRAQLYFEIAGADDTTPLILDKRTVAKGSFKRVIPIEAMWTTPVAYNAIDPRAPDFYRPSMWYLLGSQIHASRFATIIQRQVPDMLKPAFNFGGISLSQLAEPYVDNWLRTRQSVSDLISNFSITALSTEMGDALTGGTGADVLARAKLFTQTRSNRGLMVLDKDTEELSQTNTPLSGLHELQAQSQEQMCSVSRMPAIVLTGISPSGLNASSEGEISVFYDWIAAQQESHWREPIQTALKLAQLSLYGEIDPNIGFAFLPLEQRSDADDADIRLKDSQVDQTYVGMGALDPTEVRERLARDPNSGYVGIDLSLEIEPPTEPEPDDPEPPAQDAKFKEEDHPRADNGQFGAGALSQKANAASVKAKKDNKPESHTQAAQAHADAAGAHSQAAFEEGASTTAEHPRAGVVKNHLAQMDYHTGEANKPKATHGSHKDANGHDRSDGLTHDESLLEGKFHAMITKKAGTLINHYKKQFGNVVDPDAVKKLNKRFANDPTLAAAVHEPSSRLAKLIFTYYLKAKANAGDHDPVVFTAGGSGSGKSTTMKGSLKALRAKPNALLYDSVLSNPASAKARIDEALATQKGDVGIAYTNADIAKALFFNGTRERSVSIDTLMNAHVGASDTLRELAEHYKDNPRVKFSVVNNRGTIDQIAPGTIDDVPKYERFTLRDQLVKVAQGMLDDGDISPEKFALLTR